MPVQWVNRPEPRLPRLLPARSSAASSGRATASRVLPSGRESHGRAHRHLRRRPRRGGRRPVGDADARRRDRRQPRRRASPRADAPPEVADQFEAHHRLDGRRAAAARAAPTCCKHRRARRSTATITPLKYKVNVNTLEHARGDDARAERDRRLQPRARPRRSPFDPYADNRDTGGFILIDRLTNDTVGAGLLHFALRRVAERPLAGARRRQGGARARCKGQQPVRAVVHRPLRRRQVDDRQPRREASCTRSAATPTCSTATTSATA